MWRSYLAAALRNLARNRLHSTVSIAGLTIGFAAALLIALFAYDELSYDRFIPGHTLVYRVSTVGESTAGARLLMDLSSADLAASLQRELPVVSAAARLKPIQVSVRRGDVEYMEELYWADPSIFTVLALPALRGDTNTALLEPGTAVITRRLARKYFGHEDVIGQTLEIRRRQTLTVTAVLEDLPSNTHLASELFVSGRASYAGLAIFDARPVQPPGQSAEVFTYLRVKPGVTHDALDAALLDYGKRHMPKMAVGSYAHQAVALTDIHLAPAGLGAMKPPGSLRTIQSMVVIGLLIVGMATINFVNLMTARAAQRTVEVGVRKVAGADRRQLMSQFMGEALLHVMIGLVLATALVEVLLPQFGALLDRDIAFRYWEHPLLLVLGAAAAAVVGVIAGAYPALVLSGFRPAVALYDGATNPAGVAAVRKVLVVLQFAILIGLTLATLVVYRQTDHALHQRLQAPADRLAMIRTSCGDALRQQIASLPGVHAAACAALSMQNISLTASTFKRAEGPDITLRLTAVDPQLPAMLGLAPLAGRQLSRERESDRFPAGYGANGNSFAYDGAEPPVVAAVINESTVRQLRLRSPADALGMRLRMKGEGNLVGFEVVGVTPDFMVDSIREPVQPTVYYFDPQQFGLLAVQFSGQDMSGTLSAIGTIWKAVGEPRPLNLVFFDRYLAGLHADVIRQSMLMAVFAFLAMALACIGLFSLAAFMVQRRTKEIGIRKALGAERGAILRLLLWDFTRPVLWANLLAWPVAFYLLRRWLQGFAYRIDLQPWMFATATLAALVIAMCTVAVHIVAACRAPPAVALRHS